MKNRNEEEEEEEEEEDDDDDDDDEITTSIADHKDIQQSIVKGASRTDNIQEDANYWEPRFDVLENGSTSTLEDSSSYDIEEDSSIEFKDVSDREMRMRMMMMLERHDNNDMEAMDLNLIRNSEESKTYSQKFDKEEVNTWSREFQGIRGKENIAFKENQDGEESQPNSERERGSKQLVGDYRNFLLPGQKLFELTADGNKAVAYSSKDMLWRSSEDHKKDLRTVSPHEKEYLCRNSDMLAAFEIEEHCNPNKKVQEAMNRHERIKLCDQFEDPMHESLISQKKTFKYANPINNSCHLNTLKATSSKNIKMMTEFDDTNSWITNNSELLDPEPEYGATLKNLGNFNAEDDVPKKDCCGDGKNNPIHPSNMKSSSFLYANDKRTHLNPDVSCHSVDKNELTENKEEFIVMGNGSKEAHLTEIVKVFKDEFHHLKIENERLEKLLKKKIVDFSKERALWEQKILSNLSMFNTYKEETYRLRKERLRLEEQTKLLAQLPTKKERNEMAELRKKIISISSLHAKKESSQNMTINRLRRIITDKSDQIQSLQDEVKRYERVLQAEWATDGRKMIKTGTSHDQDNRFANKYRNGRNWSRVSTTVCWTRKQQ